MIGVAIGTLIAMCYQTVWMARYDSKNLIKWPFKNFMKQMAVDLLTVVIMVIATIKIEMLTANYAAWTLYAVGVSAVSLIISTIVNVIFYQSNVLRVWKGMLNMFGVRFVRLLKWAASKMCGGGTSKK